MKRYTVDYSDEAKIDLRSIWLYFEERFGERSADAFVEDITSDCEDLSLAPLRGHPKPGAPEGYRVIGGAKGRVSILFAVEDETVLIVSVWYAGRDN